MTNPTCETCRWWEPLEAGATPVENDFSPDGWCKRSPPQLSYDINAYQDGDDGPHFDPYRGIWPSTHRGEWCGEHAPHPPVLDERTGDY